MTRVVMLTTLLATSAALLLLATGVVSPAADDAPSTSPFHENQRVVVRQSGSALDGRHGEITDPDIGSGRDAMVLLDSSNSDQRISASRLRPEADVVRFQRTATAHYDAVFDPAREGPRNALWLAQGMHANAIGPFRTANPDILAGLYKESIYVDAGSREPATGP